MPLPAIPHNKLKPRKFYRSDRCSSACSLSEQRLPGDLPNIVHGWFEAGQNNEEIIASAAAVGVKISNGAVGRHRKNHLVPMDDQAPDPTDLKLDRVNHIEVLEQLVARGAKNIHAARITPEMTIKAIDMIYRLTQGSQMDELLGAVTKAMAGGDDDEGEYLTPIEAAEAKRDADEAAQGEMVIG